MNGKLIKNKCTLIFAYFEINLAFLNYIYIIVGVVLINGENDGTTKPIRRSIGRDRL